MSDASMTSAAFITTDNLLTHWQAHRRLTRRVIEAFPDEQFSAYSIGGMRTFGSLSMELLAMAAPVVRGVVTEEWDTWGTGDALPKADVLRRWDESTEQIDALWPKIPAARFNETMKAFGMYEDRVYNLILYAIENEIHHRAQGYVYLRALGIEPPAFYDRS
jgi:uncharacterized damage-inducible protein DinB